MYITNFIAKKKRKGHGSKLMKQVLKLADLNGHVVTLQADRYVDEPGFESNMELAKFYEKFGFEPDSDQSIYMIRTKK